MNNLCIPVISNRFWPSWKQRPHLCRGAGSDRCRPRVRVAAGVSWLLSRLRTPRTGALNGCNGYSSKLLPAARRFPACTAPGLSRYPIRQCAVDPPAQPPLPAVRYPGRHSTSARQLGILGDLFYLTPVKTQSKGSRTRYARLCTINHANRTPIYPNQFEEIDYE